MPSIQDFKDHFWPAPCPETDLTGKTAIATGANIGLGLEAARHLVRLNASKVILGCRAVGKGEAAKADIESSTGKEGVVEVWQVDLGSFESVREFCARADKLDRLDILLENAGVASGKFALLEGHEEQITVNVISTFLMALMLLPALRRTGTRFNTVPHLTIVSSSAHFHVPSMAEASAPQIFEELRRNVNFHRRYSTSKLLEVFVVRELATATGEPKVIINTANPGYCKSDLYRNIPFPLTLISDLLQLLAKTSEAGSRSYIAAAVAGESGHGKYFHNCAVAEVSAYVRSAEGVAVQKRVFTELMGILDGIEPGIVKNI